MKHQKNQKKFSNPSSPDRQTRKRRSASHRHLQNLAHRGPERRHCQVDPSTNSCKQSYAVSQFPVAPSLSEPPSNATFTRWLQGHGSRPAGRSRRDQAQARPRRPRTRPMPRIQKPQQVVFSPNLPKKQHKRPKMDRMILLKIVNGFVPLKYIFKNCEIVLSSSCSRSV